MSPQPARRHGRRAASHADAIPKRPSELARAVTGAVRPFIVGVMKVQRLGDSSGVDPRSADRTLRTQLARAIEDVGRLDLSARDLDDVKFALVVFADEKMQENAGSIEGYWAQHAWAREMYNVSRGGEEFYARLEKVRDAGDRLPVAAVYFICMRLGFYGAYRDGDEFKRDELLEALDKEVFAELVPGREPLSPRAERPYEKDFDQKRANWLTALVIAMAVTTGIVFVSLWSVVDMQARDLINQQLSQEGQGR